MEKLEIPKNPIEFFVWLKESSERYWENIEIKKGIFGFQTQSKTKWLAGLSEKKIKEYEKELGFLFPEIYKLYLQNMNGTDKPAINIYGHSETVAYASEYYSYPRDLEIVKDKIKWIYEEFSINEEIVLSEKIPHIIPIVGHRFLIADNCVNNPILSIYGIDSILYAPNLESFLVAGIFQNHSFIATEIDFQLKLWLDGDLEYLNN